MKLIHRIVVEKIKDDLPFDEKSLDFICRYLTKDGDPARFTPDNILAKACRIFRDRTGRPVLSDLVRQWTWYTGMGRPVAPLKGRGDYSGKSPLAR